MPFMLAQEECQLCLQVQHSRTQSWPAEDNPHGQTPLPERGFFFETDDLEASLSDMGESVCASGLRGLSGITTGDVRSDP